MLRFLQFWPICFCLYTCAFFEVTSAIKIFNIMYKVCREICLNPIEPPVPPKSNQGSITSSFHDAFFISLFCNRWISHWFEVQRRTRARFAIQSLHFTCRWWCSLVRSCSIPGRLCTSRQTVTIHHPQKRSKRRPGCKGNREIAPISTKFNALFWITDH